MIFAYVILSYLSLIAFGLTDNIRGPLFPELLQYFGVSNSMGSWFYAVTSIFSFLGSWSCLDLLKRIDRIQNLYGALCLTAVGLIWMSFATDFSFLLVGGAIMGLGFGLTGVSTNILATVGTSRSVRQRVISGLHAMYGLSSFLAPLLVTVIYRMGADWRACFRAAAVLSLLLAAAGFRNLRREDKALETKISGESSDDVIHEVDHLAHQAPRAMFFLGPAIALYVVAEILISSRLALFLRLEKSFDLEKSSLYVTGFFLCLLLSRLFFSVIHIKNKVRSQLLISLVLSFVTMILGLKVHEFFLILTGLTMGPFFALSIIYIAESFPKSLNPATAVAMASQSFFVVLMHLGSGWVTDSLGATKALFLGPICLAISFLMIWRFPKWKKH